MEELEARFRYTLDGMATAQDNDYAYHPPSNYYRGYNHEEDLMILSLDVEIIINAFIAKAKRNKEK